MAMAADAPQIATAPPVSSARRHPRPSIRAPASPNRIVAKTPAMTRAIGSQPSPATRSALMRTPSNATPIRRIVWPDRSMPGTQRPSSARKPNAMPSSRASSIAGAP